MRTQKAPLEEVRNAGYLFSNDNAICNFCGRPDPLVRYFVGEAVGNKRRTIGQWLACGDCTNLITRNDRHGLLIAAVARLQKTHGEQIDSAVINAIVADLHASFWDSWPQREDVTANS